MAKKRSAQQLMLDLRKRGGRRKGAGRPSVKGERRHDPRPRINGREPMHVTIKLRDGMPSLRQKTVWKIFRRAVERAKLKGLRLAQFAILSNHAHLLIEAQDNETLTSGLKSLMITMAKGLNKFASQKGRVLKDRYHLHVLKTPSEVRRVLSYIFANEAKHRQSRHVRLDIFASTALMQNVQNWLRGYFVQSLAVEDFTALRSLLGKLCVAPRTWLLRSSANFEHAKLKRAF